MSPRSAWYYYSGHHMAIVWGSGSKWCPTARANQKRRSSRGRTATSARHSYPPATRSPGLSPDCPNHPEPSRAGSYCPPRQRACPSFPGALPHRSVRARKCRLCRREGNPVPCTPRHRSRESRPYSREYARQDHRTASISTPAPPVAARAFQAPES